MMNRGVMNRQMFKKGGAAGFPDVSGDGKITQKDILMARGVEFKQDGGPAGKVPNDVQAIFNGLVNAMRGSEDDVARYVAQNQTDLIDIAKMFPGTAPTIEAGFGTLMKKATPPAMTAFSSEMVPSPPMTADMPGPGAASTIDPYMYGGISRPVQDAIEGMTGPGESVTESPLTTEENGRFNVYPPTQMQMGGEPMAAAMEQGNMAPAPMAAPPMPANLGPAEMDGIASQVNPEVLAMLQGAARSFGDPEQAESFEDMMNMVRGVPATEEERRQELAGVVGPGDAQQTPDSVLALLQPTMLLMDSPETEVDTGGIGPMAQTAMDVPIQGDMAQGIMSMAAPEPEGASPPVNFNQGGEIPRFANGGVAPYGDYDDFSTPDFPATFGVPVPVPLILRQRQQAPSLQKAAADKLAAYKAIVGERDEQADKDLAQAQFFQDIARFGFGLMQPGRPGESLAAQAGRVGQETKIGQNTLNILAKQKAARDKEDRALKLAAVSGAETQMAARAKAIADRETRIAIRKLQNIDSAQARALEAAKYRKDVDSVDTKTGITYKAVTTLKPGAKPGTYVPVTELLKRDDGTAIISNIPTDVETTNIMDPEGRMVLHSRRKGVPGAQFTPVKIDGEIAVTAPAKTITVAGKVYKAGRNGLDGTPVITTPDFSMIEEQKPDGSKVNVLVDKNNPNNRTELGTKERPQPTIKIMGRRLVSVMPKPDGTGYVANELYKAAAEEQLFTLGNDRYAYNPDTGDVKNIQTGKTDPEIKIVNNRLVRVNPSDPNDRGTVLLNLKDPKKFKIVNYVFGSQDLANKFGNGNLNQIVTKDEFGNLYIERPTSDGSEPVPQKLSAAALKGGYLPSDTNVFQIRETLKAGARDEELVGSVGPNGIIQNIDAATFNTQAPSAEDMSSYRIVERNGQAVVERTSLRTEPNEGLRMSMAAAAREGLGFWSGVRERLSKILSPIPSFGTFEETASAKNALRRLLVLTRDAFVNSPRMPVAELERVATIYANPDLLFQDATNAKNQILDLRDTLRETQKLNLNTLRGNFSRGEKDKAREGLLRVSRVLSMMEGLEETGSAAAEAAQQIPIRVRRATPPPAAGGSR